MQFLAPQDGKDGRRIRGAHHGRQKEASEQRRAHDRAEHQPDEKTGEEDGKQHANGGKQHSLTQDGARFMDGRFQPGREQDDGHREMADALRQFEVIEPDAEHILAGHHSQQEEQQQGRHAVAGPHLGHQNRGKDQDGAQKEQVLRKQVHRQERQTHHWISKRFRNPVIMNTLRMLSPMLRTITFPPFSVASLRRTRKSRSPELEM